MYRGDFRWCFGVEFLLDAAGAGKVGFYPIGIVSEAYFWDVCGQYKQDHISRSYWGEIAGNLIRMSACVLAWRRRNQTFLGSSCLGVW